MEDETYIYGRHDSHGLIYDTVQVRQILRERKGDIIFFLWKSIFKLCGQFFEREGIVKEQQECTGKSVTAGICSSRPKILLNHINCRWN